MSASGETGPGWRKVPKGCSQDPVPLMPGPLLHPSVCSGSVQSLEPPAQPRSLSPWLSITTPGHPCVLPRPVSLPGVAALLGVSSCTRPRCGRAGTAETPGKRPCCGRVRVASRLGAGGGARSGHLITAQCSGPKSGYVLGSATRPAGLGQKPPFTLAPHAAPQPPAPPEQVQGLSTPPDPGQSHPLQECPQGCPQPHALPLAGPWRLWRPCLLPLCFGGTAGSPAWSQGLDQLQGLCATAGSLST